jgi:hypothetical protein
MRRLLVALAGLAVLAGTLPTSAQPGGSEINTKFQVTSAAGPWMICAASYSGPKAPQLTYDLITYIQQDCRLNAYAFNRGKEEREKQQQEIQQMRQLNPTAPIRAYRIEEQFAVLIGGYKDMETARKALEDIRKLKAPPPQLMDQLSVGEGGDPKDKKAAIQSSYVNPFTTAFVVPNPTVKVEPPAPKPDPFIWEINKGETYSFLYKCPKQWTLAIKDFTGGFMVKNKDTEPSGFLDKMVTGHGNDRLTASALQAHELARLLREDPQLKRVMGGYDAYVLHTRHLSVVSVGAFDGPEDPKLKEVQRKIAQLNFSGPGGAALQLWDKPLPMEKPKK